MKIRSISNSKLFFINCHKGVLSFEYFPMNNKFTILKNCNINNTLNVSIHINVIKKSK